MISLSGIVNLLETAQFYLYNLDQQTTSVEDHRAYGALFLVFGGLLIAEALSGGVWQRSLLRTLLLPATLIPIGAGVVTVSLVQPSPPLIHVGLGALLLAGGLIEVRSRLRQLPRLAADPVAVPALLAAGILIGPVHYEGTIASPVAVVHWLIAGTIVAMALVRLGQHFRPASAPLMASFGGLVVILAVAFLLVPGGPHHA